MNPSVTNPRGKQIVSMGGSWLRHLATGKKLVIATALILAGCGKTPNEQKRPSSSLTREGATRLASRVVASLPSLSFYSVTETHSMEPVIYGNSIVLTEPVSIADVQVGDIILWRKGAIQVPRMHQVYSTDGIRLGVRGVNNLRSDNTDSSFITDSDLVGRYVGHLVFHP